jgi:amidase
VRCKNGAGGKVGESVPVDACVVTRVLDAGSVVRGKAACERIIVLWV